jgi:hypothetical protein
MREFGLGGGLRRPLVPIAFTRSLEQLVALLVRDSLADPFSNDRFALLWHVRVVWLRLLNRRPIFGGAHTHFDAPVCVV